MLPAEGLFACVYALIDEAIKAAELAAIAEIRHLPGRRSEAGFLAEVARHWRHLFPRLPRQSEASRPIPRPRDASGQLRAASGGPAAPSTAAG